MAIIGLLGQSVQQQHPSKWMPMLVLKKNMAGFWQLSSLTIN
ncbi:unnamed protein product [marine sediment metagenome]|uniref:Uncharacterized protein n=1 Tax=marine sediment metagenome TaxID=412755 RepID=X0TQ64_9ZZZZ